MLRGHAFEPVVGGAPALQVVTAAPHRRRHAQRRRLAAARVAHEVHAAAIGAAGPGQHRPREGAAHPEDQPRVAHAQPADAIAPLVEGATLPERAFGRCVALEQDALAAVVAQRFAGQHVGPAMPAHTINDLHQLGRPAALQVGRQQRPALGIGRHHEALIQQFGAVRGAIAGQHLQRHQPAPAGAEGRVEFQQQRRAVVVSIPRQRRDAKRAAHLHRSRRAARSIVRRIEPQGILIHAEGIEAGRTVANVVVSAPRGPLAGRRLRFPGLALPSRCIGRLRGLYGGLDRRAHSIEAHRLVQIVPVAGVIGQVLGEHGHAPRQLRRFGGLLAPGVAARAGCGGAVIVAAHHDACIREAPAQRPHYRRQVAGIEGHSHRPAGGFVRAGSRGIALGHQQHGRRIRRAAPVHQPGLAAALQEQLLRAAAGRPGGLDALQVPQLAGHVAHGHQQHAGGAEAHAVGLHALAHQVGRFAYLAGAGPQPRRFGGGLALARFAPGLLACRRGSPRLGLRLQRLEVR